MRHEGDTVVPGTVSAIYLKLESPTLVAGSIYDVCYDIGNIESRTEVPVREKELQFAPRCPILVHPSFVPEGQIVCRDPADGWIPCEIVSSFTSAGEAMESYMVALLNGAGKVSGVPREMVRYRKSLPLLQETEAKPAALPTEQEDTSTASALGSMSSSFVGSTTEQEDTSTASALGSMSSSFVGSTVTDTSTAIVQRLAVPPGIDTVAVKNICMEMMVQSLPKCRTSSVST